MHEVPRPRVPVLRAEAGGAMTFAMAVLEMVTALSAMVGAFWVVLLHPEGRG